MEGKKELVDMLSKNADVIYKKMIVFGFSRWKRSVCYKIFTKI